MDEQETIEDVATNAKDAYGFSQDERDRLANMWAPDFYTSATLKAAFPGHDLKDILNEAVSLKLINAGQTRRRLLDPIFKYAADNPMETPRPSYTEIITGKVTDKEILAELEPKPHTLWTKKQRIILIRAFIGMKYATHHPIDECIDELQRLMQLKADDKK